MLSFFSFNLSLFSTQRSNSVHRRRLFLTQDLSRLLRKQIALNTGQKDCFDKQKHCFSPTQVGLDDFALGRFKAKADFAARVRKVFAETYLDFSKENPLLGYRLASWRRQLSPDEYIYVMKTLCGKCHSAVYRCLFGF